VSTIVAARQRIADAVGTVTDVTGFVRRPTTPKAGDAWPLWDGAERADGGAFVLLFRVRVFLPQGEIEASAWIDDHLDALYDAIEPAAFVDGFRPVLVSANADNQYALDITVRSE
jgi:hypothetical protein